MRAIFADTSYWLALINRRDGLRRAAQAASSRLGAHRMVTSEMVLVEVLNAVAESGTFVRNGGVVVVSRVVNNPEIEVVAQTASLFRAALALYQERPDKDWSLTDCASFLIMDERKITEALTHDGHFEQNGYRALLRG